MAVKQGGQVALEPPEAAKQETGHAKCKQPQKKEIKKKNKKVLWPYLLGLAKCSFHGTEGLALTVVLSGSRHHCLWLPALESAMLQPHRLIFFARSRCDMAQQWSQNLETIGHYAAADVPTELLTLVNSLFFPLDHARPFHLLNDMFTTQPNFNSPPRATSLLWFAIEQAATYVDAAKLAQTLINLYTSVENGCQCVNCAGIAKYQLRIRERYPLLIVLPQFMTTGADAFEQAVLVAAHHTVSPGTSHAVRTEHDCLL